MKSLLDMVIYKPPENLNNLEGNALKDFVQEDIVNKLALNTSLVAECATGFGKTKIAIRAIERIRKKTDAAICIVVPTEDLLKQWWPKVYHFGNVHIYIINTYTNLNNLSVIREGIALIVDECDTALNKEAENFSKVLDISSFPFRLLLSASLEAKHKNFLSEKGINTYYQVNLYWCYRHDLLPFYRNVNIPIGLTSDEKLLIHQTTTRINATKLKFQREEITLHSPFDVSDSDLNYIVNKTGWNVKEVRKQLFFWSGAIATRKKTFQNALGKLQALSDLYKLIGKEKTLVFCSTADYAKKIETLKPEWSQSYIENSSKGRKTMSEKDKTNIMNLFLSNEKPYLISIKKLIAGFDVPDCRFAVRTSFTSKSRDGIQSAGRVLRFDENNPNKKALIVNFYVDDFRMGGNIIESQEKKWLLNSQKDMFGIEWLDSVDDLISFFQ